MTLAGKISLTLLSLFFVLPAFGQTIPNSAKTKKDSTVTIVKRAKTADDIAYEKQYEKNILKTRIDGIYIPKDLYDSFEQLKRLMGPETTAEYQALSEERAGKKLYLVMWIANNWNFRSGSRLSHNIRSLGITYPENMAHFVMICFHRHLNNKELDLKERVAFYKEKEKIAAEKNKKRSEE